MAAVSLGTALAASAPAFAQTAEVTPASGKVFGYQDVNTGKFHSAQIAEPDVTATPTTGTITATLTIRLSSTFPAGFKIVCGTEIDGQSIDTSNGTGASFEETSSTVATVSGTTATCTVKTPYAWTLPAGGTVADFVTGEYSVNVYSAGSALPTLLRSTEGRFLHLTKLPAFGTVTSVPVSVTL
jgi:hypothetical protein